MYIERREGPFEGGELRMRKDTEIFDSEVGGPTYLAEGARIGPHVIAGRYVGLSVDARLRDCAVGSFCCFGARVSVNPFQHPMSWLSTHGFQFHSGGFDYMQQYRELEKITYDEQRPVTIGSDVWLGHHAIVLQGVTIGDGAVVGAGAVVTKNVRPYAIVAGVPARFIRLRFSQRIIDRLLKLKWWSLPLPLLDGCPFDDVPSCLEQLERRIGTLRAAMAPAT